MHELPRGKEWGAGRKGCVSGGEFREERGDFSGKEE
jgi:hypothetical protein